VVEKHEGEPLVRILLTADRALVGTRGVAGALLRLLPHGRLQFAGVGNVGLAASAAIHVAARSSAGILGRKVRNVRAWEATLSPGDGLVMYTDGISIRHDLRELPWGAQGSAIAEAVLRRDGKPTDDATCMVVRCLRLAAT
jgi:hypothetical protein